jgi:hypothetical protein
VNEQDIRALVRDAIARQAQGPTAAGTVGPVTDSGRALRRHSSHAMFVLPVGTDGDGPCLIEPAVTCNHCGYCRSYGH